MAESQSTCRKTPSKKSKIDKMFPDRAENLFDVFICLLLTAITLLMGWGITHILLIPLIKWI